MPQSHNWKRWDHDLFPVYQVARWQSRSFSDAILGGSAEIAMKFISACSKINGSKRCIWIVIAVVERWNRDLFLHVTIMVAQTAWFIFFSLLWLFHLIPILVNRVPVNSVSTVILGSEVFEPIKLDVNVCVGVFSACFALKFDMRSKASCH